MKRDAGIATAGMAVVLFAGAAIALRRPAVAWPTAVVRSEPFAETIVETGSVTAQRMRLYASTIAGAAAKIIELAPEGRTVGPGDVLVRFDTSQFELTRETERAALRQAEADLVRATEDARLESLRAEAEISAAKQQIANAERGLVNEAEGKGHVAVIEAEAALAEAERELAHARTNVEDLKPLLAENFITRTEFERAEQALRRADDQKRLAAARRDSLVRFERPAATSRAEAEVNSARDGLLRQADTVAARAAQRRAAIAVTRSRVEELRGRIASLTDQIDRATVRADGPGLVVYRELFFGTDHRKPQVGDEVFPNQPLIALPDSSQLSVDTRVREIDLHKLSTSQRVVVRVDAYPDLRLPASIDVVGALAQEDAAHAGTKYFPVTIKLGATDARLRTGMTARVEIDVSSIPSAALVPLQAVFDDNGSPYLVVLRDGRPERRAVRVAAENDSMAAIASGVAAGERVLLVDPTSKPTR